MTDEPLSLPPGFDRELTQLIDAIETLRDALSEEETLTTVQAVTTRRRLFLALYALKAIRRQLADTEHPLSQGDHEVVTWDDPAQGLYHIELRLNRLLEDLSIQIAAIDILLRVNAEESRAVRVSGFQSDHRTTTPFGHG